MASRQLTLFMSDYDRLAEQRDFAAYRALGSISAAIVFVRQNRIEIALEVLTRALETYERADSQLQQFLKKGDSCPRTANPSRPRSVTRLTN